MTTQLASERAGYTGTRLHHLENLYRPDERTSPTRIEASAPELDWLNKGGFASLGGRQPSGVIYHTFLVG
jgi:hypothetical protein